MIWLVFAVLTLVSVSGLMWPFLRRPGAAAPARVDYDVVIYRDQLREIDGDVERGLVTPDQADAARTEIHRRMLAAEDTELRLRDAHDPPLPGVRHWRLMAGVVLVPAVGAILLYTQLGSPQLPGQAYAQRAKTDPSFLAASKAADLAETLRTAPTLAGYRSLAQLYVEAGNHGQAAAADRKVIEMGGGDASTWSELGESYVMSHDGEIPPEALMAFTQALAIDPKSERARFYIGLAETQIGNNRRAVAIWRDLERDSLPEAPWMPMLREHIAVFSKEGGFDPKSVPPSPPSVGAMQGAVQSMMSAGAPSKP